MTARRPNCWLALASMLIAATVADAADARAQEAGAEEARACPDPGATAALRLLRRLSLDLRGRIPSVEEYERVRAEGEVSEALIDELMATEEFGAMLRRYHRGLLWGTLAPTPVMSGSRTLVLDGGIYFARLHAKVFRGANVMRCLDQRQTNFDAAGRPVPIKTSGYTATECPDGTCRQEGWVEVSPYWAPLTTVKVCAYDAQALTQGLTGACGSSVSADRGCGCGPNLRGCATSAIEGQFKAALVDEPLRIAEAVVLEGRPYREAFTTRETFLGAKSAHFYRYYSGSGPISAETGMPATLPTLPWDSDEQVAVERGPEHGGMLTTPAFLLRFASQRSRVSRFYEAFLCRPLVADPNATLPPATDPCSDDPNLATRCGCASCHAVIEPATGYWGRWRTDADFGHLTEALLPDFNASCANCKEGSCSQFCNRYYMTADNASHPDEKVWHGTPIVRAWSGDAAAPRMAGGPAALFDDPVVADAFAECTARTVASHLLRRPLTEAEEEHWVPDLVTAYEAGGERFLDVLRAVLASETYRKAP